MADWYVSSAVYASIPAFQISHAYSVGDFIVPTAPASKAKWVFRCTTAGTSAASEPSWTTANNGTTTSGGATFTHVTGQSTYGWSAAAGDLASIIGNASRFVAGDRCFVSSDHVENTNVTTNYGSGVGGGSFLLGQILCVNRAGSVPPVVADLTTGATINYSTGSWTFEGNFPTYHYGIAYNNTSASGSIQFNSAGHKIHYFDNCSLYLNSTSTSPRFSNNNPVRVVLNNSTLRFGNISQAYTAGAVTMQVDWTSTPSAITGTPPTSVFLDPASGGPLLATCRGVDFSGVTTSLVAGVAGGSGSKFLFDSCKIASGVIRYNTSGVLNPQTVVELINCFDGTNVINESYQVAGTLTTDTSFTLTAGAADDNGPFSHRIVTSANCDKWLNTMHSFWMDVENTSIGSSKTATVEIVSLASLNNDEASLLLEYQGTSGSSVASLVSTMPATILTAASTITSSTATWNLPSYTSWSPTDQQNVTLDTPRLTMTASATTGAGRAIDSLSSGKYYWEYTFVNVTSSSTGVGIAIATAPLGTLSSNATGGIMVYKGGTTWLNGASNANTIGFPSNGSVVCVALDVSSKLIWFRLGAGGSWNATSGTANNPATGTGGISLSALATPYFPACCPFASADSISGNFGQSAFVGAVPSGFTSGWPTNASNWIKQKLQTTFTPQKAGRVRGQVRVGKTNATVYVNPVITIT